MLQEEAEEHISRRVDATAWALILQYSSTAVLAGAW
jgi:hypothetical protein